MSQLSPTDEMTARYLRAVAAKHADPVTRMRVDCPWCGKETFDGDEVCCEELRHWTVTTYPLVRRALRTTN